MSISVALEDLPGEVAKRGPGYLLSTNPQTRPHVMHVRFSANGEDGGVRLRAGIGRSASANIAAQGAVTLLWPPENEGDYSLIVDGEAEVIEGAEGAEAAITAVSAVLHRPA